MAKRWILLMIVYVISTAATEIARDYYTAAVLEHYRLGDPEVDSPQEIIRRNLHVYTRAVHVAKEKGADIIVFPEFGIFPHTTRAAIKPYLEHVPDPQNVSCIPCNNPGEYANRPILFTLSCLAKDNGLFVVANMADVQPCKGSSDCRDDGVYQYNTNVVFDRNGTLVARYHKVHLCYEDGTDPPNYPQNPVFFTDFGTFSTYICFDILFKDIVETAPLVDNIAFPTMWFNAMPILNSVQLWQAFSITNNVTILAANLQYPNPANTGSGIFTPGQGAVKYTLNNDQLSKLIVSKVPQSRSSVGQTVDQEASITVITENGTDIYSEEQDGRNLGPICDRRISRGDNKTDLDYLCWHDNTENYTFAKLTEKSDSLQLCRNGMCCSLNYSTPDMKDDFYLGVHNQTYSLNGRYFWCLESCVVLRCERFNNKTCGTFPLSSQTTFTHLELKANFTTKNVYPSVIKNDLRLAELRDWSHSIKDIDGSAVIGQLSYGDDDMHSPLVVAALVGRCYNRDPPFVP